MHAPTTVERRQPVLNFFGRKDVKLSDLTRVMNKRWGHSVHSRTLPLRHAHLPACLRASTTLPP